MRKLEKLRSLMKKLRLKEGIDSRHRGFTLVKEPEEPMIVKACGRFKNKLRDY